MITVVAGFWVWRRRRACVHQLLFHQDFASDTKTFEQSTRRTTGLFLDCRCRTRLRRASVHLLVLWRRSSRLLCRPLVCGNAPDPPSRPSFRPAVLQRLSDRLPEFQPSSRPDELRGSSQSDRIVHHRLPDDSLPCSFDRDRPVLRLLSIDRDRPRPPKRKVEPRSTTDGEACRRS